MWESLAKEAEKDGAIRVSEMLRLPQQLANVDQLKFSIMKQKAALEVFYYSY
jgi:hypothetical protein